MCSYNQSFEWDEKSNHPAKIAIILLKRIRRIAENDMESLQHFVELINDS